MIINNKYKITEKIGSGSFGLIYKGINIRTNEYVAVKVERIKDNLRLLKNETSIYRYLKDLKCVPQIKWFGKDEDNYYMVINLLGYSLQDLINKKQTFSLQLVIKIGIKIVNIIKEIHDEGFIHRDIKPDNFLFGQNDLNQLYLIDFGFSKAYSTDEPMKKTGGLIGSNNYASISSHKLCELSRRDDIESICYMLLYFYKGSLPWNNLTDQKKIMEEKERITEDKLGAYPEVILRILKYTRQIEFHEQPNYYLILHQLKDNL